MIESKIRLDKPTKYYTNITSWKHGAAERLVELAGEFGFKAEITLHRFEAAETDVPSLVITPTRQGISTAPLYERLKEEFPTYWKSEVLSSEKK